MQIIETKIDTNSIKLASLLKSASMVSTADHAKLLIQNGEVEVNGAICTQCDKEITRRDQVSLGDTLIRVV